MQRDCPNIAQFVKCSAIDTLIRDAARLIKSAVNQMRATPAAWAFISAGLTRHKIFRHCDPSLTLTLQKSAVKPEIPM